MRDRYPRRRACDFVWLRVAPWLQNHSRMPKQVWLRFAACGATLMVATAAQAQDNTTPTVADFALTIADSNGPLTSDGFASYFSQARCACSTTLTATLTIGSDAAAKLGGNTIDAVFMVGDNCGDPQATGCTSVSGHLTLSAAQTSEDVDITTSSIFAAVTGLTCPTSTTSSRLWAIIFVGSTRLTEQPSVPLTLGGPGPSGPTDVKTVSADKGLLVSWTATGDGSTLLGHQVLCSPGPAKPSDAWYDTCGVSNPNGGAGPFDSFDPKFVCSGLIAVGTNSTRVQGLENGRSYQIAVVAVGLDATPSAPSAIAEGTPAPTVGFGDLYGQDGGSATGCAVGGGGLERGAILAAIAGGLLLAWRWRRRRRTLLIALLLTAAAGARPAAADIDLRSPGVVASPRLWNVELRFGPYRPNVDSEFADRGESARPYETLFSSSRHLMTQLEIDRQLSHRGGTWGLGVGVGYFNVTAAALTENLQSRSGDQTGLRLIPLTAVMVYRADMLRERWGSPVVPYAKAGLDCALWRISDTSQANINGRTLGWHAAAGVTIDLSPLDPEAAGEMDRETGVNQTAVFFEVARYSLDGFGSGNALHVGDTTWFAGLMLEL